MSDQPYPGLSDDELEALAAEVLGPVTPARKEMAVASLDLQDLEGELAQLLEDSRVSAGAALRDGPTTSAFQLTIEAGPTRLLVNVEMMDRDEVEVVVLVAEGPPPHTGRLRSADGSVHESTLVEWPLIFRGVRSTATICLEIGDSRSTTYFSPWIGL